MRMTSPPISSHIHQLLELFGKDRELWLCWKQVCHWEWALRFQKAHGIPRLFFFPFFCFLDLLVLSTYILSGLRSKLRSNVSHFVGIRSCLQSLNPAMMSPPGNKDCFRGNHPIPSMHLPARCDYVTVWIKDRDPDPLPLPSYPLLLPLLFPAFPQETSSHGTVMAWCDLSRYEPPFNTTYLHCAWDLH